MSIPEQFSEGATFDRADGALLRIDRVTDEQIYFVSWRPGQETGCPIRMDHATFLEAWAEQWERKP
ncbi:MAG: hypothetical protein QG571_1295 [Pseudomonadota bacterium]|nr:hypothetical protein [Pseudomonadota bacterium]